jgi:hypothetical protein
MESALFRKVKLSLSIANTSNTKNEEIELWIDSAIKDLKRQAVDVDNLIENELVIGAIIMYVKGHFGMCDIKEKEQALQTYKDICHNLPLSKEYIGTEGIIDDYTLVALDEDEGE